MMLSPSRRLSCAGLAAVFTLLANSAHAQQAFTLGDVIVYRVGTGSPAALTANGNPVFLDEFTPAGALVQSIALPSAANRPLVASGTALTDGLLTRSANGKCLVVPGYGRDISGTVTGNLVSTGGIPRVVGIVSAGGAVDTSTALTDTALVPPNATNFRSAASADCNGIWTAGSALGIRYTTLGATTSVDLSSTTFANTRALSIFGGQLYVSASVTNLRGVATVGSGLPTSGQQTLTKLPGMTDANSNQPYAFFMADLSAGVAGMDTMYVTDDTAGTITKFSKDVSGTTTWIVNGTVSAPVGQPVDAYRGLTGAAAGTSVTLYAVRNGNELVSLVDASGYKGAFSGTPTHLASAAPNTAFRGVSIAPAIPITITSSADTHAHISPATPQVVNGAGSNSFTVLADAGYALTMSGSCAGTLVGSTYTVAPSLVSCAIVATTIFITHTVTPSATAHGTISPASLQVVPFGASATFSVAPDAGYSASVDGTCGGTLSGTTYITASVTANCTVDAVFTALPTYFVTPIGGTAGTVVPNDTVTVISGHTPSFTVMPVAGQNVAVRGTCGGQLTGNTFTTAPVTRDCTVVFAFAQKLVLFVGNSFTFGRVDPVMSYNTANVTDLTDEMWRTNSTGSNADEPHPWGGIPSIFKKLTDEAGLEYDVSISARNAASLRGHYLNLNPAGWDLRGNIASQKWDTVILQDLSDEPLPANRGANANLGFFNLYTDKLVQWVHVGNDDATVSPANQNARASTQVFLYETWARPDMIGPHGDNASGQFYTAAEGLEAMTADFHTAYFDRAAVNPNIAGVSAVGDAFLRAVQDGVAMRDPYVPEAGRIDLWHTDFFHPSKYGSYLSALVHVATITGVDPMSFGASEQAAVDLGISPEIALQLQRVARETVMPDTIAPMTTATVSMPPNNQGWNQGSVTVTFNATDNPNGWGASVVSYSLAGVQTDSGTVAPGGAVTVSAEGETTITYFATDVAGNAETARTLVIRIDSIAPVLMVPGDFAVDAPGPGGVVVSYTVTAEDTTGLMPSLSCLPPSGSVLPIGTNTISCSAIDAADNAANASFVVTVRREALPPTTDVSLSVPANDAGWNQGEVTIAFAATDNPGGWGVDAISYALAGAESGSGSFAAGGAITIAAEGVTTISYFATDLAGNAEAARVLVIRIDMTPPIVTVPADFSIDATGPLGAIVHYVATVADNSGLTPVLACLPASGSTLPIGTHTIACTAADAAGNSAAAHFTVTVDGAAAQTARLITAVLALGDINVGTALASKLTASLNGALNSGNNTPVCAGLSSFAKLVTMKPGRNIPVAQATELVASANRIKAVVGCR